MSGPGAGRGPVVAAALVLGTGLVVAQAVQAWAVYRREQTAVMPPAVAAGALCSVMLANGQVYYGDFVEASPRYVTLSDVYYVQVAPAAPGQPPGNRLVSRRKGDWHAPSLMSIPADKVMMVEAVGPGSRLAQLVKQDRATPVAQ